MLSTYPCTLRLRLHRAPDQLMQDATSAYEEYGDDDLWRPADIGEAIFELLCSGEPPLELGLEILSPSTSVPDAFEMQICISSWESQEDLCRELQRSFSLSDASLDAGMAALLRSAETLADHNVGLHHTVGPASRHAALDAHARALRAYQPQ